MEKKRLMERVRMDMDVYHNCGNGECVFFDSDKKKCRRPAGVKCSMGDDYHGGYFIESGNEEANFIAMVTATEYVENAMKMLHGSDKSVTERFLSDVKRYDSMFGLPHLLYNLYKEFLCKYEYCVESGGDGQKTAFVNLITIATGYLGFMDFMAGLAKYELPMLTGYRGMYMRLLIGKELGRMMRESRDGLYKKCIENIEYAIANKKDKYGFNNMSVEIGNRIGMIERCDDGDSGIVRFEARRSVENLRDYFLMKGCSISSKKYFTALLCAATDYYMERYSDCVMGVVSKELFSMYRGMLDFIKACPFIQRKTFDKPMIYYDRSVENGDLKDGLKEARDFADLKLDYLWDRM